MKRIIILLFVLCTCNKLFCQSDSFNVKNYSKTLLECYSLFKVYVSGAVSNECNGVMRQAVTNRVTLLNTQLNKYKNVLKAKLGTDEEDLELFVQGCVKQPEELTADQYLSAQMWLRLNERYVFKIFMKLNIP